MNPNPLPVTLPNVPLSDAEFDRLRRLVYAHFGILLTESKRSLVTGRLNGFLRASGFRSYSDYCAFLENDVSGQALSELVNRISTNHTFFYREEAHFTFLQETLLPEVRAAQNPRRERALRLWSAGCSSGEEPYMLAMMAMEALGTEYAQWDVGILATDIAEGVLETARAGIYPWEKVKLMPATLREKYLTPVGDERWQVREPVRRAVTFRKFNLKTSTLPFHRPFHAIFCRNVMIYFSEEVKRMLVRLFHGHIEPEGYLFIGHSESLRGLDPPLRYVAPAIYQKE